MTAPPASAAPRFPASMTVSMVKRSAARGETCAAAGEAHSARAWARQARRVREVGGCAGMGYTIRDGGPLAPVLKCYRL